MDYREMCSPNGNANAVCGVKVRANGGAEGSPYPT